MPRLMSIAEWQERYDEKKALLGRDAAPPASPGQVFLFDKWAGRKQAAIRQCADPRIRMLLIEELVRPPIRTFR